MLGYGLWRDENVFTALLLAGFRWGVGYGQLCGLVGGLDITVTFDQTFRVVF